MNLQKRLKGRFAREKQVHLKKKFIKEDNILTVTVKPFITGIFVFVLDYMLLKFLFYHAGTFC